MKSISHLHTITIFTFMCLATLLTQCQQSDDVDPFYTISQGGTRETQFNTFYFIDADEDEDVVETISNWDNITGFGESTLIFISNPYEGMVVEFRGVQNVAYMPQTGGGPPLCFPLIYHSTSDTRDRFYGDDVLVPTVRDTAPCTLDPEFATYAAASTDTNDKYTFAAPPAQGEDDIQYYVIVPIIRGDVNSFDVCVGTCEEE